MESLLQGHAHTDYVVAFRWTVVILAGVTALASRVFSQLRPDRPARVAPG